MTNMKLKLKVKTTKMKVKLKRKMKMRIKLKTTLLFLHFLFLAKKKNVKFALSKLKELGGSERGSEGGDGDEGASPCPPTADAGLR